MDRITSHRWIMAAVGGLAGLALYALVEVTDAELISDRTALLVFTFAGGFFAALLALAGQLPFRRAVPAAALLAAVASGLLYWASFRFDLLDDFMNTPLAPLAAFGLGVLPLPFIMAAQGSGWRDYPSLFRNAWGLAFQFAAASLFVGIIWLLLYLSDALLTLVGITVIDDLIDMEPVPFLITGFAFGLSLAVVTELAEIVSPSVILRLFRLLAPLVLGVIAVFLAALPFRGLSGLFDGLSAAGILLAMAAVAAGLVSMVIDQDDASATASPVLRRSAQGLAMILPVLAALSVWSVWLRVDQYGWTPERIFAVLCTVLALGYGGFYAAAVLRGGGWMERIRQGNILMAIAGIAVCLLILTPVLNPERISAASQLSQVRANLAEGRPLDLYGLTRWGKAGEAALAELRTEAEAGGSETLLAALETAAIGGDGTTVEAQEADAALRKSLTEIMPVQPAAAEREKAELIAWLDIGTVRELRESCEKTLPAGGSGCVMVVADFWPEEPGNEVLVLSRTNYDYVRRDGYARAGGSWTYRVPAFTPSFPSDMAGGEALIAALQAGPPRLSQAPVQQIEINSISILLTPGN